MNTNFFDDEEELDLKPRRRSSRRSEEDAGFEDEAPRRPVRRTRSESRNVSSGSGRDYNQGGRTRNASAASQRGPVRRKSSNEIHEMDDFEGFNFRGLEYIKYIALALMIILVIVGCIVVLKIQAPGVILCSLILAALGFFSRKLPVFVQVLIAFLVVLIGILVKQADFMLYTASIYLSAVLVLKD